MASRLFSNIFHSLTPRIVSLHGRIILAAGGAVNSHNIKGVTSVTKTGTGIYEIKLKDIYVDIYSIQTTWQSGTFANIVSQVGSIDLPNKTIVVRLHSGGTLTDPASASSINVIMFFKNSKVG